MISLMLWVLVSFIGLVIFFKIMGIILYNASLRACSDMSKVLIAAMNVKMRDVKEEVDRMEAEGRSSPEASLAKKAVI